MDTNKNRLNLFIELSAIQAFLQKHVPENLEFQKVFTDCAFTVDIIDAPQRMFYRADHETAELELDRRGSMYMAEEQESLQEAHLILNQEGAVQGNAPQELQNVMQIYLMFCLNMSVWLREHGVFDRYSDLNPESQGVLIEENGDRMQERPVSGRERPDLACKLFTGEVKMMRPYSEDMMRGVLLDAMPLEKKEAAAEAGDTGMMQHLFEYYMGNNVSPHKDLMNNMKKMQKLMKAISGEGSDETEEDEEEEDTRNPEKAFYWLKKLAESGDVESAKLLSKFYSKGFGCERDFVQAVRCLDDIPEEEKAEEPIDFYNSCAELFEKAKAGDADAQCSYALNLAMLGKLVPSIGQDSDYAEAFQWAQKAAAQNNLEGMAMLVTYFQQGIGVPKDEKKAFRLCEKAAMRGHSDSQERLARMYFEGIGTEKDTDKAIEWAQKAADQGDLWAMKTLIRIYVDPEGGKHDLTEAKIWAKKAADLGDEESKKIYEQIAAAGLSLDDTEDSDAFKRVKAEAENGSVAAMNQLARYYAHRPGGREDLLIAQKWAQMAADRGDTDIRGLLDELSANLRDEMTSFEDAQKAAEAGDASAQELLGTYYAIGYQTELSLSKALYWMRKAAGDNRSGPQEFVNYFDGVDDVELKAMQGDAQAQADLAGMYIADGRKHERFPEKPFAEALKLAKLSAEKGNPHGLFMLGLCSENGYGMDTNPEEAFRLYKQSAELGDPDGQCELSHAYMQGIGTEQNQSEAFRWAKSSADLGNGRALANLATFYEFGVGGAPADYEEAVRLMQKAVEQDVPDAERELALLTSAEGKLMVGKTILGLKPEFGEPDREQAARLIEQAAECGNGEAQFLMGMLNLNGVGVEQDYEKAVEWFRKGAESGNEDAAKNLAQYDRPEAFNAAANMEFSKKEAADKEKVFRLKKCSAEGGFAPAQDDLGFLYMSGYGTTPNYIEGMRWFQKAAEQGHANAIQNIRKYHTPDRMFFGALAAFAVNRKTGITDSTDAFELLEKAADAGSPEGLNMLGVFYADPKGMAAQFGVTVEEDCAKAKGLFEKALQNNPEFKHAENNLKKLADLEEAKNTGREADKELKWAMALKKAPTGDAGKKQKKGDSSQNNAETETKESTAVRKKDIAFLRMRAKAAMGLIACSSNHVVAVKPNGTVIASGNNNHGQCNVAGWKNIVAVDCDEVGTVGLTSDGYVKYTGGNFHNEAECASWGGIKQIAMSEYCVFGLKKDGTVICTPRAQHGASSAPDVTTWKNIVEIRRKHECVASIDSNGKVISLDRNHYGKAEKDCHVSDDAIDAAVGSRSNVIVLHKDGTCYTFPPELYKPEEIVKLYMLDYHPIALLSNGRIIQTKHTKDEGIEQFAKEHVDEEMIAVSGNTYKCAFLTEKGRIYVVGYGSGYGDDVKPGEPFGEGFRLFDSFDSIIYEKKEKEKKEEEKREEQKRLREKGLCQYCGGDIKKGFFGAKCVRCGKKKDY